MVLQVDGLSVVSANVMGGIGSNLVTLHPCHVPFRIIVRFMISPTTMPTLSASNAVLLATTSTNHAKSAFLLHYCPRVLNDYKILFHIGALVLAAVSACVIWREQV